MGGKADELGQRGNRFGVTSVSRVGQGTGGEYARQSACMRPQFALDKNCLALPMRLRNA